MKNASAFISLGLWLMLAPAFAHAQTQNVQGAANPCGKLSIPAQRLQCEAKCSKLSGPQLERCAAALQQGIGIPTQTPGAPGGATPATGVGTPVGGTMQGAPAKAISVEQLCRQQSADSMQVSACMTTCANSPQSQVQACVESWAKSKAAFPQQSTMDKPLAPSVERACSELGDASQVKACTQACAPVSPQQLMECVRTRAKMKATQEVAKPNSADDLCRTLGDPTRIKQCGQTCGNQTGVSLEKCVAVLQASNSIKKCDSSRGPQELAICLAECVNQPTADAIGQCMQRMGVEMSRLAEVLQASSVSKPCRLDNYARIGSPFDSCAPEHSFTDGMCYKACPAGWTGKATDCYQSCPGGFRDDGLYCAKPAAQTSAGYVVWDEAKCKRDNPQGCYKSGALWFPHCKDGFKRVSDQICSPVCPGGFQDIGVSCKKPVQSRGAGIPKTACSGGRERIDLLCYESCKPGFKAAATLCMSDQCPAGHQRQGNICCAGPDCARMASLGFTNAALNPASILLPVCR